MHLCLMWKVVEYQLNRMESTSYYSGCKNCNK